MSLDDWAVRNIEEAARKAFFGDYMKDKVDDALDIICPVDIITFKALKDDPQFESDWAAISTASLPLVFGDESEGIGDS